MGEDMIISNQQVNTILKALGIPTQKPGGVPAGSVKTERRPVKDEVSISETGMMQSVAVQALKEAPDTRPEKVDPLRTQMGTGGIAVSDDQIAQKILDRLLIDEFAF
jgi:anti-sigma28 factor (negative regulator of flagellin synthesis)